MLNLEFNDFNDYIKAINVRKKNEKKFMMAINGVDPEQIEDSVSCEKEISEEEKIKIKELEDRLML